MADKDEPLVSVGVPVFNGENGISCALDSLLAQAYPNLEIIISDNASTDRTQSICEDYARRDSRIRYHRATENHGAIWNYNRVFELSAGKYFMWAAHDDERKPEFVRACVEKLESHPSAVLCQAWTSTSVEGRDEMLCICDLETLEGMHGLIERYREAMKHLPSTAVYGLCRSSAMRMTKLFQKGIATDVAFLQEMSLRGDFVEVPEVLFNYFSRKKWNTIHDDYRTFFGKPTKPWWYLPFVSLFLNHWKRIARADDLALPTKIRLWSVLIDCETERLSRRFVIRATGRLCPERWKEEVGRKMYWWWLHSPNVKVRDDELFLQRVIRPMVGWWRD